MSYKRTVILVLTIALFGHLVAAGRTLHDQATNTDASDIESRKLVQPYGINNLYDGSAETITAASDLIAQTAAAGARPAATAAAATRGAEYASLATEDSQAGKANPELVRKRSMLQRVFSTDKPDLSRPLLGAASGVPAEPTSAVAGAQHDVKSASLKAGADYLKLSTVDPQMMLPKEDIGAHKRSLLQRYKGDEYSATYSLNAASDVIAKAVDSGADPAVTKWATERASYYARMASLRGGAWFDDSDRK